MAAAAASFTIVLPTDYRRQDILAFHGRDTEPTRIRKGMTVDGVAVVLDIALSQFQAVCHAHADDVLQAGASTQLHRAARGILGLQIDPVPFSVFAATDTSSILLLQA